MSAADWAQVASAFFAAVAALAAWASVARAERDRWRRTLPDLHVEVLVDMAAEEVRVVVMNHGGPAREVRVLGVLGDYGFVGLVPPTSYWRAGESRSVRVAMPPVVAEKTYAFVEGRDMAKRQLIVGTVGGATYRWPLRKARKLSPAEEWKKLFPDVPSPLDVRYPVSSLTLVERVV